MQQAIHEESMKMRILIAEDDLVSRMLLHAALNHWPFQVVVATCGEEAWQIMQQEDAPRLAIVDWMMPGMDGLELCRRLRDLKVEYSPYLILLTTRDTKEDIVTGLNAGANDYLAKPFDINELRARIDVGRRMVEMQRQLVEKVSELREALDNVKFLRGILPICARCKKIRDDQGYWNQVEIYISNHSEAEFSHGLCPDCAKTLYPEYIHVNQDHHHDKLK